MSLFHNISNGSDDITNIVIEIPKGSRNKYEYDKDSGAFVLDRVLYSPFFYPVDYGFVPKTWYDDNDPLDGMVHIRDPTFYGCVIEVKVLGMLRMKDEKGVDDKLLGVPTGDPIFQKYQDITDMPSSFLDEVSHFFQRYKDLEKGKSTEVIGWLNKDDALKALQRARKLYDEKFKSKK